MRKSYLLVPALFIGAASFGQRSFDGPTTLKNEAKRDGVKYMHRSDVISGSRAYGDTIMYEPFNGSLNGWTVDGEGGVVGANPGTPANQIALWDIDGTNGYYATSGGQNPPIILNSPTKANGFAMMDVDFLNGNGGAPTAGTEQAVNAGFVSPVMNLSTYGNVSVKFYHNYALCCWSGASVPPHLNLDVSTNGFTNFTSYDLTYSDAGINIGSGTRIHNVNITSAISSGPSNVQIRFRMGTEGSTYNPTAYWWMIDDIAVYETEQFRAELDTLGWSVDVADWGAFGGFQQIPSYAATTTTNNWSAWLFNQGGDNWTNAKLTVTENGTIVANSTGEAINAGNNSAALHVASAAMPTAQGTYAYQVYPTADQTMGTADTFNFNIDITDKYYSAAGTVANGDAYGNETDYSSITEAYAAFGGSVWTSFTGNEVIDGIRVTFADEVSNQFAPATAVVEVDGSIVATKAFTVDDQLLGMPQDIFFDNQIQLSGGDQEVYFYIQDNDGELIFATSGNEAYHLGLKWIWDTGGQQYLFINEPAMVSLITQEGFVSVEENELNSINSLDQNWPNPFDNTTLIRFNLGQAQDCSFQVTDVTGKVVKTINLGSRGAGQHQVELNAGDFKGGIYFYTLTAGDSRMTKKMIVTK